MKQLLIFILVVGIISGCAESNSQGHEGGIIISGSVKNAPVGIITIEKLSRTNTEPIDTIILANDNTYSHRFQYEPGFYKINFFNEQAATIIVDQDDLVIDYDGSDAQAGIRPQGSREIAQIEQFYKTLGEEFGPREQAINNRFVEANQAGDTEKVEAIRDEYMDLQKEKQKFSAELVRTFDVNLATYQLISSLDKDNQLQLMDSLAGVLNEMYPDRFYIEDLVVKLEKARATAIGSLAPEITLPNPDGEIVKLSSLQGQVVLVDFWAQWCKPCRMENPNVVAAYNKYKDKGFTVYGVSLDRTKDKWLQAIEEDGLTWTHVSDLKYFNSVAAQTYDVSGIPFSILLDRNGKIIAKNLRGQKLHSTLDEYFATEGKL